MGRYLALLMCACAVPEPPPTSMAPTPNAEVAPVERPAADPVVAPTPLADRLVLSCGDGSVEATRATPLVTEPSTCRVMTGVPGAVRAEAYAEGMALPRAVVTWKSSEPSVISTPREGGATVLKTGDAFIAVEAGGLRIQRRVTVTALEEDEAWSCAGPHPFRGRAKLHVFWETTERYDEVLEDVVDDPIPSESSWGGQIGCQSEAGVRAMTAMSGRRVTERQLRRLLIANCCRQIR